MDSRLDIRMAAMRKAASLLPWVGESFYESAVAAEYATLVVVAYDLRWIHVLAKMVLVGIVAACKTP